MIKYLVFVFMLVAILVASTSKAINLLTVLALSLNVMCLLNARLLEKSLK